MNSRHGRRATQTDSAINFGETRASPYGVLVVLGFTDGGVDAIVMGTTYLRHMTVEEFAMLPRGA